MSEEEEPEKWTITYGRWGGFEVTTIRDEDWRIMLYTVSHKSVMMLIKSCYTYQEWLDKFIVELKKVGVHNIQISESMSEYKLFVKNSPDSIFKAAMEYLLP